MLREGTPDASEMHNRKCLFLYRLKKKKKLETFCLQTTLFSFVGKVLLETQSPVSPHFFWHFLVNFTNTLENSMCCSYSNIFFLAKKKKKYSRMAFPNTFRMKQWNDILNVAIPEVVISISGVLGSLRGKATLVQPMAVRSLFLGTENAAKVLSVLFLSLQSQYVSEKSCSPIPKFLLRENWFLFWPGISLKKKKKVLLSQWHLRVNLHFGSLPLLQSFWHRPNKRTVSFASLQVCSFASLYILETQMQRIHWDLFENYTCISFSMFGFLTY